MINKKIIRMLFFVNTFFSSLAMATSCEMEDIKLINDKFKGADYVIVAELESMHSNYSSVKSSFQNFPVEVSVNLSSQALVKFRVSHIYKGTLNKSNVSVIACPGFLYGKGDIVVLFLRTFGDDIFIEKALHVDSNSKYFDRDSIHQRLSVLSEVTKKKEKTIFCFALYTCSNIYEIWPF